MSATVPISIAAAANLLALYGIIEVQRQPAVSASVMVAAGMTMLVLCVGMLTGWELPQVAFQPPAPTVF